MCIILHSGATLFACAEAYKHCVCRFHWCLAAAPYLGNSGLFDLISHTCKVALLPVYGWKASAVYPYHPFEPVYAISF